jgi:hypothetical protein
LRRSRNMSWIKVKRVGDRAICQCPTDHHKEPSRSQEIQKDERTKNQGGSG